MDPRVFSVARTARAVSPETRLAVVADIFRMSPYPVVPVVEAFSPGNDAESPPAHGRLLGLITEADLVARLLAAGEPEERARVRELPARDAARAPEAWVTPGMRASEAAPIFDAAGVDVLPVLDGGEERHFLGLLGRSDLVRDLVRPFRPPVVGGMATPLGVYLTTGGVSGGVGTLALAATGFLTLALQVVSAALFVGFVHVASGAASALPVALLLPPAVRFSLGESAAMLLQTLFFLCLLRYSPLAGYHAAEHQVVHALERGEPLLTETVRAMPRVHPRCSTNLVAGALLLWLTGSALHPVLGVLAYLAGGVLAVGYWRAAGAFLQKHFTTRPATDRQIESGIRAAHALLEAHGRSPFHVPPPHARLWRMGFLQIFLGAGGGLLLLFGLAELFPALGRWLNVILGA